MRNVRCHACDTRTDGHTDSRKVEQYSVGAESAIPHIPVALKGCIKTQMGSHSLNTGDNKVKVGKEVKVAITIQDPRGKHPTLIVQPVKRNIQLCTKCEVRSGGQPKTRAYNSSHIVVSWDNLFHNCKNFEVRDITIIVNDQSIISGFDVKNKTISNSPCLNHSISVGLNFKNTKKDSLKSGTILYEAEKNEFCRGAGAPLSQNTEGQGITLNLGFVIGTAIPLTLLCCVAGLMFFVRKRSTRGQETFQDQDDNPVYGIYASDRMDTTEATDNNEVYGGGEEDEEEAERANQLHDVNPYYE